MTLEGIWTAEVHGMFVWDGAGIYIFENGRIMGGDSRMYCHGPYSVSGDVFESDWAVQFFGQPLTVFGESKERVAIKVTGKLDNDVITATIRSPDRPGFELKFRLTRRADLPGT